MSILAIHLFYGEHLVHKQPAALNELKPGDTGEQLA